MKAAHVQSRIDKRGVSRCQPYCPGWIIRTNPGKPKIMACAACNALHPARLQITDKMVKLLPLATEGLAVVSRTLRRERMERATTRHAPSDPDAYGTTALCGHEIGRTKSGRRVHVVAFRTANATCAECIRLAEMTPAARLRERELRSEALAEKFKTKREDAEKARTENDFVRELIIAEARVDAVVAMDMLELVDFDRERLLTAVMNEDPARGDHARTQLAFVDKTLASAVTAYRHVNRKSRGHRRWVFRSDTKPTRLGIHDVQCRFCKAVLFKDGCIGDDYTTDTDGHTVRCALEYLAGTLPITANTEET